MEINGIAHIQLTVNDLQRSMPFYERVLGFMGMRPVVKGPNFLYMIGGRTAVAVTRSSEQNRQHGFDQKRIGLHHLCFRARLREDIKHEINICRLTSFSCSPVWSASDVLRFP